MQHATKLNKSWQKPMNSINKPTHFSAIIKKEKRFPFLNKQNLFINANPTEGNICLEVWKYNPGILSHTAIITELIVDPLSLYLTLKNTPDERIEMALEQIIEQLKW